ncbi:hypothetical protein WJX77_010379 [Trebouxia sp. C0004]
MAAKHKMRHTTQQQDNELGIKRNFVASGTSKGFVAVLMARIAGRVLKQGHALYELVVAHLLRRVQTHVLRVTFLPLNTCSHSMYKAQVVQINFVRPLHEFVVRLHDAMHNDPRWLVQFVVLKSVEGSFIVPSELPVLLSTAHKSKLLSADEHDCLNFKKLFALSKGQ